MNLLRGLAPAMLAMVAFSAPAAAQGYPGQQPAAAPSSNPACVRLETQLAAINHGQATPRAPIRSSVTKTPPPSSRPNSTARSPSRASKGARAWASSRCSAMNEGPHHARRAARQRQPRGKVDPGAERSPNGSRAIPTKTDSGAPLSAQLAQNDCGPQYRSASTGPGGFFGALFGSIVNPSGDGAPSGTYRTVCVRTCDGYYFPISYSTVPGRFADDQSHASACARRPKPCSIRIAIPART